jgi:hypothetical protein
MLQIFSAMVLAIAAQTGGVPDHYPPPGITGTGAGTTASGSTASGATSNKSQPPPGSGAAKNSATLPGDSNIFGNPPSNVNVAPITPLGTGGSAAAAGQAQSPQSNLGQGQPNFSIGNPPATQQTSTMSPTAMMQAFLTAPIETQLRGEPIRLVEAVNGARSRNEQSQRVEAYWDLCASVADYYLCLREQDDLGGLGKRIPQPPSAAWQQYAQDLTNRSSRSLRAARASQYRLAAMIGRGTSNLPLPTDRPHCGSYTTFYQENFAGRNVPEAQELASLLPQLYSELKQGSADVMQADEWLRGMNVLNTDADVSLSLRLLELLALRRQTFVQIARDYNHRITRYSELSTPGQLTAERLIAMLIYRPSATTAPRSSSPISPGKRQSSAGETSPPQTFVSGSSPPINRATSGRDTRDDAVRPASGSEQRVRQERSLMLPPRDGTNRP